MAVVMELDAYVVTLKCEPNVDIVALLKGASAQAPARCAGSRC